MTVINFKLKDFDKILPVGQEPNLYLSWFWLTDGDLWLTFDNVTIYEYTKDAIAHFGDRSTPYNDYYLVRFLEDFTELFGRISESIPKQFYDLTEDLNLFRSNAQKWLDIYDTDENEYSEFYFQEYDNLVSWTHKRQFDSGHLIGGPHLSFFRHNEKIRIIWDTEYSLGNGINLWTAKDGSFEMDYSAFIDEIKKFGDNFFKEMDKQIELTLAKEWDNIKIDKQRLIEEHKERRLTFDKNISYLLQDKAEPTNWAEIEQLYNRMLSEIK